MRKSRSLKNLVCSILGQAAAVLAGLVLTRLILVGFGSAANGLITSVNQIFTYFILLEAGIGTASLQALYGPVAKEDRKQISAIVAATKRYYDRTAWLYLVSVLVFAAVYGGLMGGTEAGGGISGRVMAGVIVFTGLGNVINFKFQGKYKILMQAEGRNYVITNIQTVIQILNCLAKAVGIYLGADLVAVIALGFLVTLLQTLYYWYYVKKHYHWLDLSVEPARVEQTGSVLIHQVSQLVFQNTDVLILTVFCGLKTVSIYAAYKVVVSAIATLTYNISESFVFILGQEFASDRKQYIRDIDRFDVGYTGACFALFTIAYVLYLPFIELYTRGVADANYLDPRLPLLFIAIELLSGCRRAMQNTINVAGHFHATIRQTVTETVINLTVSLFCVVHFGLIGVLCGTIAALLYRSNEIIWYGNRKILGRSPAKSYRIYGINVLLFVLILGLSRYVPLHFEGYGDFIRAGVLVGIPVFAVFLAAAGIQYGTEKRSFEK